MTVHAFRFHTHQFQSRVRAAFEPRKPRHRLLRVALGVLGLVVLAGLVVVGAVVGAAMLLGGLTLAMLRNLRAPRRTTDVMSAEYRVIDSPRLPRN